MPTTNISYSYKIARYAVNIIKALKHAYNIKDKRDLFTDKKEKKQRYDHHLHDRSYHKDSLLHNRRDSYCRNHIGDKLRVIANYDQPYAEERVSAIQKQQLIKKTA